MRAFSSKRAAVEYKNAKAYSVEITHLGLVREGAPAMNLPVFAVYASKKRCPCCECRCECHGGAEPLLATSQNWTCSTDAYVFFDEDAGGDRFYNEPTVFRFDEYGNRGTIVKL